MHFLDHFNYCPHCGSRHFAVNDFRSKRCANCGFTLYHNASASTAAFILNDKEELLVCQRALEPAKGTLDLPGGFVDPNETLEECCLREIEEETGCKARILRYLFSSHNVYPFSGFNVHTVDAMFLCQIVDGTPKAHDDVAELSWIPIKDIHPEDFGLPSISRSVAKFLTERNFVI